MDLTAAETQPWPQRAWMLAAIGLFGGVAIHFLVERGTGGQSGAARYAAASFIGVAALIFGHGWARGHAVRAAVTAALGATVIALVFLWNGTPDKGWSAGEGWRIAAAVLAVFVLVPMIQTASEQGARRPRAWSPAGLRDWAGVSLPYASLHGHAWTNVLVAGLSLLFAGAFLLMLMLVAQLFRLIDLRLVEEVMREEVTIFAVLGGAIGASTGLLREKRAIIASLQGVVMMVLRIAAPVMAVALLLFLAALPFTGLTPLWEATRSTTPILLAVGIVALLLINSVVAEGADDESRARAYRAAAVALALAMAPLAIIAAVSTGLRVRQYGWTPDRLWATVFVAMACVTAATYFFTVLRRPARWAEALRGANRWLAIGLSVFALVLSTPLVRFDAVATNDQVARLIDGRIPADKFDWMALRFDFGEPGKAALARLATSGNVTIRAAAVAAQAAEGRYAAAERVDRDAFVGRLKVLPRQVAVPETLLASLGRHARPANASGHYLLFYRPGDTVAVLVSQPCKNCVASTDVRHLRRDGSWTAPAEWGEPDAARIAATEQALARGEAEIRQVKRRQVFVGGQPVGRVFE